MPHNRYYLPKPFQVEEKVYFEDKEFHHLTNVMRQKKGEEIEIMNGMGQLATGTIVSLQKTGAEVLITNLLEKEAEKRSLILALAYLKPQHLEFALEKTVELGVSEIWLFPGGRSEKKGLSDTYMHRLETIVISACKQCGRLFLPKIVLKKNLQSCVDDTRITFFGNPDTNAPPFTAFTDQMAAKPHITLCIGPEAGFTEHETKAIEAQGALGVHFHPNILRAETAAICGVALLQEEKK